MFFWGGGVANKNLQPINRTARKARTEDFCQEGVGVKFKFEVNQKKYIYIFSNPRRLGWGGG